MTKPEFAEKVMTVCHCTHDDVIDHVEWYVDYLKRIKLKKDLLAKWRNRR